MKVGDQKQAIALGVVALLAVGMLGKTALGAFAGNNGNQPLVVKDIGGNGERVADVGPTGTDQSPKGTEEVNTEQISTTNSTTINRDAFEKPKMPQGTKPFGALVRPIVTPETIAQTGEIPPAGVSGTLDGGSINSLPKGVPGKSTSEIQIKKSSSPLEIGVLTRFDGCVEAGSPMGIVSVNGDSFSVGIGDAIGTGYRVESISSQKITIRKGKIVKTILIGKETKI